MTKIRIFAMRLQKPWEALALRRRFASQLYCVCSKTGIITFGIPLRKPYGRSIRKLLLNLDGSVRSHAHIGCGLYVMLALFRGEKGAGIHRLGNTTTPWVTRQRPLDFAGTRCRGQGRRHPPLIEGGQPSPRGGRPPLDRPRPLADFGPGIL